MKLFYATSNTSKIYNMKRRLEGTNIVIVTPMDLGIGVEVEENGNTPTENARKKAFAYSEKVDMPVIAGDSGLYIEGVAEVDQPGLYVKRVNGRTLTNDEMIERYCGIAKKYGGKVRAHYFTGLVLIVDGEEHAIEIPDDDFIITSEPNPNRLHRGNPLDVLTIEPISGKFYNELTDEESLTLAGTFDRECIKFLEKVLHIAK